MASSNIDWICGQCTHKNEGSSEPGPCHFCQTPHPKRKAVVVSVPTSALPAKSVCIRQPARSSGSAIDLSAPDAAQAVASALPVKPVCIGQPVRYSGSVIDLSDPDRGQDAGRVPSSSKGLCSSGIYGSHEGRRYQGANDGVSSRPQRIWLGCVQPLLQDECVGPFPQLTCVRSASFWPLSNC